AGHRTIPLIEAVEIVKAAAAALQAAHSRGVVHGELNPTNVFLARVEGYDQGVVKLLNFGIARLRPVDAVVELPVAAARDLATAACPATRESASRRCRPLPVPSRAPPSETRRRAPRPARASR